MASSEMNIGFMRDREEMSYQQLLKAFLATWWCEKAVPTVPEVGFSCHDENRSRLRLVSRRLCWMREDRFETRLRMSHKLLVGWNNKEMYSIIQADLGGFYQLLPSWWDEYRCPYISLL